MSDGKLSVWQQMGAGLVLAVQFLTRVPLPLSVPWQKQTLRWAVRCFPLIGLFIGTILAGIMLVMSWGWLSPSGPWSVAVLSITLLTVWIVITGGLHIDGWADVFDALGSNAPLERKQTILKDPRIGAFGVLAVLLLLGWKSVLLYALLSEAGAGNQGMPLLVLLVILTVPAFARLGAVVLLACFAPMSREGLAWQWKQHVGKTDLLAAAAFLFIGTCLLAAAGWAVSGQAVVGQTYPALWPGFGGNAGVAQGFVVILTLFGVLAVLSVLFWFVCGYVLRSQLGGINGDGLGAVIEGGEAWGLFVAWIFISFVMG